MSRNISRRRMLAAGAASGGLLFGSNCTVDSSRTSTKEKDNRGPGREEFWGPGPDRNLVRDLTPGTTPIRLSGFLGSVEGRSIGDMVRKLRETGHTAANTSPNQDTPLAQRRLLDDVGDPRLKVNLDPTNMVHLYNHFHTAALINECFDLLGEDIAGCHAKDSKVLPNMHTIHIQEVCPGRGVLDYETYLVRMSRMKEPRALLPEHLPGEQYPEAKAFIRKIAAKTGVALYGESG